MDRITMWNSLNDSSCAAMLGLSDQKTLVLFADKASDINSSSEGVPQSSGDSTKKIVAFENLDHATKSPMYSAILSGTKGDGGMAFDLDLLSTFRAQLNAGGTLFVKTKIGTEEKLVKQLKMYGFLNVEVFETDTGPMVSGSTPAYKVGSSDKVTLNPETKENVISAWKLDDKNSETISEDDLLEADDLTKPDSSSLRVCATTKKAKACKDCSCGLAEELEANRLKDTPKPDTSNAKSSCGSCYLGDAFRCASCPYLGMPAFKPGEKVQLAGNLLQDDF